VQTRNGTTTATNEAIICQEITNGLFFEAIAIVVQSIEDIFAFLNAAKLSLKFISHVFTYPAGKIANLIKSKHTVATTASLFYFPYLEEKFDSQEEQDAYDDGLRRLLSMVLRLTKEKLHI
jgi:hypothetical protein